MVIAAGKTDKCPHCRDANRFEEVATNWSSNQSHLRIDRTEQKEEQNLHFCRCTSCHNIILFLNGRMIWPLGSARPKAPTDIPPHLAEDYNEACLVEPLSKKAAAALTRRCLQNTFHDRGIKGKDLNEEIDKVLSDLPSHLVEAIDAIRHIGNFAAHPMKYQNTGQIVDVEDGETDWALTTLYELFDHYYVKPKFIKAQRDNLNIKLKQMGKPLLK